MEMWMLPVGTVLLLLIVFGIYKFITDRRIDKNMQRDADLFNRGINPWETEEEKKQRFAPPPPEDVTREKIEELIQKNKR